MFFRFPSSGGKFPEIWLDSKILENQMFKKTKKNKNESYYYYFQVYIVWNICEDIKIKEVYSQVLKGCNVSNLFRDWTGYPVGKQCAAFHHPTKLLKSIYTYTHM